jgi:exodeoxyribonuclease V alpha subunit
MAGSKRPSPPVDRIAELRLAPQGQREIAQLYRSASAVGDAPGGADLPLIDMLTIRDLLAAAPDAKGLPGAHALVIALFLAAREGSLCLRVDNEAIASRLATFLPMQDAQAQARGAVDAMVSPAMQPILVDGDNAAPLVGERFRPLVLAGGGVGGSGVRRLYFHRHFLSEQALRRELRKRGRALVSVDEKARAAALAQVVDDAITKPRLNEQQRQAVALAIDRSMTVISGGPGTGKTTIVLAMPRPAWR